MVRRLVLFRSVWFLQEQNVILIYFYPDGVKTTHVHSAGSISKVMPVRSVCLLCQQALRGW